MRQHVAPLILVAVAAACLVSGLPAAHAGLLTNINKQRENLGLRPLGIGVDGTARKLARKVAVSSQTKKSYFQDRAAALRQGCRCLVPTDRSSDYDGTDPSTLYEVESGSRSTGFWTTRSGWSLQRRIRFAPQLAALLFDPRARRISVVSRKGVDVIAVTVDLAARRSSKARLVNSGPFDPAGKMPLIFLSDGPPPRMVAERRAVGRWMRETRLKGSSVRPARDGLFDGARRAVIPEEAGYYAGPPLLAWGSRYRIRSPKWTLTFRTTAPKGGRLHFTRSSRGYRKQFKAAIRSGNPLARHMLAQIAGEVTVATHGGGNTFSGGGGTGVDMYRGHLTGPKALRNHIVWHELGHVFDSRSFGLYGRPKFMKQFQRSRLWKCFLGQTVIGPGCAPGSEIFADQFAFWATGNTRQRSGYNVPPLISHARMTMLVRRYWAPRPLDFPEVTGTHGSTPSFLRED